MGLNAIHLPLSEWSEACFVFPERTDRFQDSAVSAADFYQVIATFNSVSNKQMSNGEWVNEADKPYIDLKPFVQKLVLPTNSTVAMWGNLPNSKLIFWAATFQDISSLPLHQQCIIKYT